MRGVLISSWLAFGLLACGGTTTGASDFIGTWSCIYQLEEEDGGFYPPYDWTVTVTENPNGTLNAVVGLPAGDSACTWIASGWTVSGSVATAPPGEVCPPGAQPEFSLTSSTMTLSGSSLIVRQSVLEEGANATVVNTSACTKSLPIDGPLSTFAGTSLRHNPHRRFLPQRSASSPRSLARDAATFAPMPPPASRNHTEDHYGISGL